MIFRNPIFNKLKEAKLVLLPNKLKEKVGGAYNTRGYIEEELLEKAAVKVEEMSINFGEQAIAEVSQLEQIFQELTKAVAEDQRKFLRQINLSVHDLKGNGASFGYPLLTEFASSLFDFTDYLNHVTPEQLEIIKAHIGVMHIVVNQKMRGDGGAVGQQLKKNLKIAIEKYS